jgi:Methyltransferase domain
LEEKLHVVLVLGAAPLLPAELWPSRRLGGNDDLASEEAMTERELLEHEAIRDYYDRVYHRDAAIEARVSHHLRRLARRIQPWQGKRLLDIGCGSGTWLRAAADLGAVPTGVDISQVGLDACQQACVRLNFIVVRRRAFLSPKANLISPRASKRWSIFWNPKWRSVR